MSEARWYARVVVGWTCGECSLQNGGLWPRCQSCDSPRPDYSITDDDRLAGSIAAQLSRAEEERQHGRVR